MVFRKKEFAQEYKFSKEFFIPVYTSGESSQNEFRMNDFTMKFSNDKVAVNYKNLAFNIDYQECYLEKGFLINGKYQSNGGTENFKLALEEYKKNYMTFYSNNPVVFYDSLPNDDYVDSFWKKFSLKDKKAFSSGLFESDSKYLNFEIPSLDHAEFYNKLFIETMRRIAAESRPNLQDEKLNRFADFLDNFNGKEINKNGIIIEQALGISPSEQKLSARDILITNGLNYIDDGINPFLTFEKELSIQDWVSMQQKYRDNYKINIKNHDISRSIDNRFSRIIKNKKFYIEEQDRLMRFMSRVITEEFNKEGEETGGKKEEPGTLSREEGALNGKVSHKPGEETVLREEAELLLKPGKHGETTNKRFIKYLAASLIGLLLIALIGFGIIFGPKMFSRFYIAFENRQKSESSADMTQKQYFNKTKSKYSQKSSENKLSVHYKFYMTNIDLLNLTNLVAERNNYHRIVYDYQKKYTRGRDPDWIFPGNVLVMPDSSKVKIKQGDTMWDICDNYLINEINTQENKIRDLIEQTKLNKIQITDAQKEFMVIKSRSHSQMMRDFLDTLIRLKSFKNWEPYIEEIKKNKQK